MRWNTLQSVSSLTELIGARFLSDNPDICGLVKDVADKTGGNLSDVQRLLSTVAVDVHRALFPPVTKMELVLTDVCNLRCTYCFEKGYSRQRHMSMTIAQKAIDLLFAYSGDAQELRVTYFGGEPTMNFKVLKNITLYAEQKAYKKGKNIEFHMTSNGVGYTPEMVDFFASHRIRVLISIDGMKKTHDRCRVDKKGHGSYERVVEGLALLKKVQPWVGAKMTITAEAVDDLFDDVVGLYSLGVNQFILGYATGVRWTLEQRDHFFQALCCVREWYQKNKSEDLRISDLDPESEKSESSYYGCQAARFSIAISPSGDISGCSKILTLPGGEDMGKLGDVMNGLTHVKRRHDFISCNKIRKYCESRKEFDNFHGGCFACNYAAYSNFFVPDEQEHFFSVLYRSVRLGAVAPH